MSGTAGVPPTTGTPPTPTDETTALRARLAAAEEGLTQTRTDLATARADLAARDAATAAASDAVAAGGAPTGASGRGGAAADGGATAAAAAGAGGPLAPSTSAPGALGGGGTGPPRRGIPVGDAPLGGDALGDYVNIEDDGAASGAGDEWTGPQGDGGQAGARARGIRLGLDDAGAYDDGFDFYKSYTPVDFLQGFDIPRSVTRTDGMPMPFTPSDPVHTATFSVGSRDELEARHWYCALAWLEQLYNDSLTARHATGSTVDLLVEQLEYIVSATRRIYALGVSRYDCGSIDPQVGGQHVPCKGRQATSLIRSSPCIWVHIP
ncbi:hypothetical protein I4F81_008747 [Pyropia yezoensis]|uniref:Uncharacterized protein n=1 Tax=Pyropia yezoensis TaxID=2788 RepID=A0ACC3C7S2_PYRYE|nr:hypothetical protein I4F81_008747 [Neopyropia yezoensis]